MPLRRQRFTLRDFSRDRRYLVASFRLFALRYFTNFSVLLMFSLTRYLVAHTYDLSIVCGRAGTYLALNFEISSNTFLHFFVRRSRTFGIFNRLISSSTTCSTWQFIDGEVGGLV